MATNQNIALAFSLSQEEAAELRRLAGRVQHPSGYENAGGIESPERKRLESLGLIWTNGDVTFTNDKGHAVATTMRPL